MYITPDDLASAISKVELIQLTNDEPRATEPDDRVVNAAIDYSCELVDGYMRGRYEMPLSHVPSILPNLCVVLARHWLHSRRINRADFPKPLQVAYENAIKVLENIRDGKIHLDIRRIGKVPEAQPERGAYHVRARPRLDTEGY